MILSRQQFIDHWNSVQPGLGDADSGLWAYERDNGPCSKWFVAVPPIHVYDVKTKFWNWCEENCPSGVACYSASDEQEWWGFVSQQEMAWFLLRWV